MKPARLPFIPVHIALLTVSDTRVLETDISGNLLSELITQAGHQVTARHLVTDDQHKIIVALKQWITDPEIDVIITTGGTGITNRDVTPEAMYAVYDKEITGFGELFRMLSYTSIGTSTIQSRATAGVAQGTYLFALPGSPGACRDAWEKILKYQLNSQQRPCNLVALLPRLQE